MSGNPESTRSHWTTDALGIATVIALLLLGLLAACVQPLEGNAYQNKQRECLADNRCWRLTKSMFYDVQGMECGERLKYPIDNYWHNSDFDIGVNCNENDTPRVK